MLVQSLKVSEYLGALAVSKEARSTALCIFLEGILQMVLIKKWHFYNVLLFINMENKC